jgi:endonuclease/exonuclease/phosphatase family metal-dependent hydrolase
MFYATTYISPIDFPLSGYLNLLMPIPFFINILFIIYWILKLKKYSLLSLTVILLGWNHFSNIYSFSSGKDAKEDGLKILSYNVMQFYSPTDKSKNTYNEIEAFVVSEDPDIIAMQEFTGTLEAKFSDYNYKVQNNDQQLKTIIFSKYKIVNSKTYDFVSNNSGISADVVIKYDTIRVFSIHFESLNLKSDIEEVNEKSLRRKYKRLTRVFPRQIDQLNLIKNDILNSPYPVVLCSDLNNTSLSYIHKEIQNLDLKDSFLEKGNGYGKTFKLLGFPLRIDMIFTSKDFSVGAFKNFDVNFSDHYPIMATIKLDVSDN